MKPKYSIDETGPRIESFLRQIREDAGFDFDFTVEAGEQTNAEFETPDLVVKFTGEDVDLLLSNRAELLLALEHVCQEALRMHSDDHSRIAFDANDYRALRIEELRMTAQVAAEKVKSSGQPFRFAPMNSRERRIIHIALRNETELRSESSGTGPFRGVVVYPAGMPSLPEVPQPAFRPSRFGRPPEPAGDRDRGRRFGDRGRGGGRGDRRGPRSPR
ncbi:MAG TPA: R3H domain-containing nucleic acid-binding protein [Bryobacteraceae bacterium]|nr:R3H domain-containing nucleic acid-binding protein [Bryobacteraceae bacterium]